MYVKLFLVRPIYGSDANRACRTTLEKCRYSNVGRVRQVFPDRRASARTRASASMTWYDILYQSIQGYTMICYDMLYYDIICYTYNMICYAMLCYIIPKLRQSVSWCPTRCMARASPTVRLPRARSAVSSASMLALLQLGLIFIGRCHWTSIEHATTIYTIFLRCRFSEGSKVGLVKGV